jgi:hypothetical protein
MSANKRPRTDASSSTSVGPPMPSITDHHEGEDTDVMQHFHILRTHIESVDNATTSEAQGSLDTIRNLHMDQSAEIAELREKIRRLETFNKQAEAQTAAMKAQLGQSKQQAEQQIAQAEKRASDSLKNVWDATTEHVAKAEKQSKETLGLVRTQAAESVALLRTQHDNVLNLLNQKCQELSKTQLQTVMNECDREAAAQKDKSENAAHLRRVMDTAAELTTTIKDLRNNLDARTQERDQSLARTEQYARSYLRTCVLVWRWKLATEKAISLRNKYRAWYRQALPLLRDYRELQASVVEQEEAMEKMQSEVLDKYQ